MNIVLGLGNPGSKYAGHRHNIGFHILDVIALQHDAAFTPRKEFSASILEIGDMLYAKPETFMNNSGLAARALVKQFNAPVVVVYDDIDIELGTIKCSFGRGAGGHNGVQSIIDHLGHKDFARIRVGVRPVHEELMSRIAPPDGFEKFLLSDFAPFELSLHKEGIQKAIHALKLLEHKTFTEVMNECN